MSKERRSIAGSHDEAPTWHHSQDRGLRWERDGAMFYTAASLPGSGRCISRHISRIGKDMVALEDRLFAKSLLGALKFEVHGMEEDIAEIGTGWQRYTKNLGHTRYKGDLFGNLVSTL